MKKGIIFFLIVASGVWLALFFGLKKESTKNGDLHGLQAPSDSGIPSSFFKITKFKTNFVFTRSEAQRKDQDFYYYYLVGLNAFYADDKQGALNNFKTALEYNDKHATLHLSLAEVYVDMGDFDLAEQHCKKVLELDPNNTQARLLLSS